MGLQFTPRLDFIAQIGNNLHGFLRGRRIVPKIRPFNFFFEFRYFFLFAREVKDAPRAGMLIPVCEPDGQANPA
jgi:hypothetical protein